MGRMSDLDILLTEPERRCRKGTRTTCAMARPEWPNPLQAIGIFPEWFHRPFEVWCLPSAVKLSEAFA